MKLASVVESRSGFRCLVFFVGMFGLCLCAHATERPDIATEEFMVPAVDSGIQLYVRNKHPTRVTHYAPDRILLYVHGATYPADATFDLMNTSPS